eukprot:SAG31_NODE_13177_length_887_cov_1.890863_2_plen_90_part_01
MPSARVPSTGPVVTIEFVHIDSHIYIVLHTLQRLLLKLQTVFCLRGPCTLGSWSFVTQRRTPVVARRVRDSWDAATLQRRTAADEGWAKP